MVRQKTAGYTIVEVTLFLAISSLLLIVAFIGTGNSIRSTRFTDTARSTHAYIQKQYDDILNGVNPRTGQEACSAGSVSTGTSQTPGTSNCLLLGKLIVAKPNQTRLQVYNVIGTQPANPDYNKSDEALIYDFQPTIVRNVGVDSYQIPWQAYVSGSKRLIDNRAVDSFALIRSPKSSRIVSYTYSEPSPTYNLVTLVNPAIPANANNINMPTNFCMRNADNFGNPFKISVAAGLGQNSITLAFDAMTGDCNGS